MKEIDWANLSFGYMKTDYNAVSYTHLNIDATMCAERPKLKAHIPLMQETMATVMGIDADDISIKATTTEKLDVYKRQTGNVALNWLLKDNANMI